jgi:hypothetical protein
MVDEGGEIEVPDFSGKTIREVTEACIRLGLEPVLWHEPCNKSGANGGSKSQARGEDHRAIRDNDNKNRKATPEG